MKGLGSTNNTMRFRLGLGSALLLLRAAEATGELLAVSAAADEQSGLAAAASDRAAAAAGLPASTLLALPVLLPAGPKLEDCLPTAAAAAVMRRAPRPIEASAVARSPKAAATSTRLAGLLSSCLASACFAT